MKMVTTKQAKKILEERGISISYPTIAQWTREGRFAGAEREETERGPVWRIPVDVVKSFDPPKPGRPSDKVKTEASKKAVRAKK
jgi:hypothetical protein